MNAETISSPPPPTPHTRTHPTLCYVVNVGAAFCLSRLPEQLWPHVCAESFGAITAKDTLHRALACVPTFTVADCRFRLFSRG